jgi:hypothetical protein
MEGEWRLYLGGKSTGIVVRSDEKYPSLFRVHWPDRPPSGAPLVRTRTTLRLSDGWTNVPQSNTRNALAVTAIRFRTNSTDMPAVTANRHQDNCPGGRHA